MPEPDTAAGHDHSACPDYGDQAEWTTQQATAGFGTCQQCGKTGIHPLDFMSIDGERPDRELGLSEVYIAERNPFDFDEDLGDDNDD